MTQKSKEMLTIGEYNPTEENSKLLSFSDVFSLLKN